MGTKILMGVNLIDVKNREVKEGVNIVIEDNKIKEISNEIDEIRYGNAEKIEVKEITKKVFNGLENLSFSKARLEDVKEKVKKYDMLFSAMCEEHLTEQMFRLFNQQPMIVLSKLSFDKKESANNNFKRYEDASLEYTGINKHEGDDIGLYDTVISHDDYVEVFASEE